MSFFMKNNRMKHLGVRFLNRFKVRESIVHRIKNCGINRYNKWGVLFSRSKPRLINLIV